MSDDGLPEGWAAGTLPEVASIIMGQSPPGKTYNETGDGLAFFQGKADFGSIHPSVREWCSAPGKIAEAGDVLISIRAPVGPTNIADRRCAIGRGLAALRPAYGIPSLFLLYAIRLQEDALAEQGTGSTFTAINRDHLDALGLCVPPLAEQQRIVAKVEALLARVNAARQRLAKVPTILKRFRQSVLAAACSGRLTADWREQQSDAESAETLLDRLADERRKLWQARNANRKYRPPDDTEQDELTEIPQTWAWTNFDHCAWEITVGHVGPMKDRYVHTGIWFLRSQNVRPLRFDSTGLVFIKPDFHAALRKSALYGGEILVTRSGANTGDCCVFPKTAGEANCADLVITRPLSGLLAAYGAIYISSPDGQTRIGLRETGMAQPHFNIGAMRVKPFPLPPLAEQHEIARRVEALFRLADAIEKRVAAAMARAGKLTQAVLAKAFRGELVPTEAELARREGRDYEPASVLLERIRTERAQSDNARQRIPGKGNARQVRRRKGQPQ